MNKVKQKLSSLSKLTRKQKIILIIIISLVFILLLSFIISQPSSSPDIGITPTPISTPSITPSLVKISYNTSNEWKQTYDQSLQEYEQQRNVPAEESLAYIRQNSPIKQTTFIVEYSYKNNTYTVSLLTTPYATSKQQAITWFQEQGIPSSVLDTLRLQWLEK